MKLFALLCLVIIALPVRAGRIELVAGGGAAEQDAPATECRLREPFGVEFTPAGEMVIVEMVSGNRVLKIGRDGILRVIAGAGAKGYSGDGGPATAATFNGIHNLAITASGDILLSDSFNHVLRRIDAASGNVSTIAGTGAKGFTLEPAQGSQAQFSTLIQIALEPAGRGVLIADIGNRRIRRYDLATSFVTTLAGDGKKGVPPDGAKATSAPLADPRGVIGTPDGGLYILERDGHALRFVDRDGTIRTVAGTGKKGLSGDDGPALEATLNGPKHLCLDRDGTVLIADAENHVIRRYDPKTGRITRVAGTGKKGAGGVGGDPLQAELNRPHGVTIGPDSALYITDSYNDRVLKVAAER